NSLRGRARRTRTGDIDHRCSRGSVRVGRVCWSGGGTITRWSRLNGFDDEMFADRAHAARQSHLVALSPALRWNHGAPFGIIRVNKRITSPLEEWAGRFGGGCAPSKPPS